MAASRIVYAVGSIAGWPFEAFALFETQTEAQRYADGSAYLFDVFPLVVYASYDDCPVPWRLTDSGTRDVVSAALSDPRELLSKEIDIVNSEPGAIRDEDTVAVAEAMLWAVGSHEEWSPEVWVLYETTAEAQRHVDASYYMCRAFPVPVYADYQDCPPEKRFTQPGPPLSQLVKPRDPASS